MHKRLIFWDSKIRLIFVIFVISLMMISCGEQSTNPTDPPKPIYPPNPTEPSVEFTLATVPTTLPVENVWIITDSGSPLTAEFIDLKRILHIDAATRKIKLEFPNIEVIPVDALHVGNDDTAPIISIVSVSAEKATIIENQAFRNSTALTTVSFPVAISIGYSAFMNCHSLINISLPKAESIGNSAFHNSATLTTVDFPVATSIGNNTFSSCPALEEVDIPLAITIASAAFASCDALNYMVIAISSDSLSLHSDAFSGTATENVRIATLEANKSKFRANGWGFTFL